MSNFEITVKFLVDPALYFRAKDFYGRSNMLDQRNPGRGLGQDDKAFPNTEDAAREILTELLDRERRRRGMSLPPYAIELALTPAGP